VNRSYPRCWPASALLSLGDALLAERDVPGSGADATAGAHPQAAPRSASLLRVPLPPDAPHVLLEAPLTGKPDLDGPAVLAALAGGRAYVGLDALAAADGFFFVAEREVGAGPWDTVSPP
jgi:hypothetical protein